MAVDTDQVSRVLGLLVVLIWLVALLPQLYMNGRRRSASGLSRECPCPATFATKPQQAILLLLWLAGDACGLLGCFLTHQLVFQKGMPKPPSAAQN
jgi:hypothetical protein